MRKIMPLFLILFVVSCASWQKNTMITYESLGEALESTRVIMQVECQKPDATVSKCESMRSVYNKAVDSYKLMGSVAILAIDSNSKIQRKKYRELETEVIELLKVIEDFIYNKESK